MKLVNPVKKSEYRVHNIRDCLKFMNIEQLEGFIKASFKEFHNYENKLCMGYIEPGYGWKGKQQWLNSDTDLKELYSTYKEQKNNILLWCHLPSVEKSRKRSGAKQSIDEPQSKRAKAAKSNEEKTTEAKKIFQTLSEKHESGYTPEQLHAWAHY